MNIGVTGHRELSDAVVADLKPRIERRLLSEPDLVCISCLAEGADQLVARLALEAGGRLEALVPCAGYERTFESQAALADYFELIASASSVERLAFAAPDDEAFLAAGRVLVRRSDVVLAIWDGEPARGLGGTADVIEFARGLSRPVEVYWPREQKP